jgi:hypothetical protein
LGAVQTVQDTDARLFCELTFIKLVRTCGVDFGEGLGDIGWWRFSGGESLADGLDGDGAVAAGSTYEFLNGPTGFAPSTATMTAI